LFSCTLPDLHLCRQYQAALTRHEDTKSTTTPNGRSQYEAFQSRESFATGHIPSTRRLHSLQRWPQHSCCHQENSANGHRTGLSQSVCATPRGWQSINRLGEGEGSQRHGKKKHLNRMVAHTYLAPDAHTSLYRGHI
ncbi:unnamed protein product, partial [Ectocarpus sp. 12 AP-2014]